MPRAPFQILVLPFMLREGSPLFALFRRIASTGGYWQGIAGGGEDDESPLEAAMREANEETGISIDSSYTALQSRAMIPVEGVCGFLWGPDTWVIPEHPFAVQMNDAAFSLSGEHCEYGWFAIDEAMRIAKWESNRTALWELEYRIRTGRL